MAKDKLRDHDSLFLVHLNWDTATVVVDRDLVFFAVDRNLEGVHGRVVDLSSADVKSHTPFVIRRINQNFVKDLVEAGYKGGVADFSRKRKRSTHRWVIILVSALNTHIIWVIASTEPMYVSGRFRTCSIWVS